MLKGNKKMLIVKFQYFFQIDTSLDQPCIQFSGMIISKLIIIINSQKLEKFIELIWTVLKYIIFITQRTFKLLGFTIKIINIYIIYL